MSNASPPYEGLFCPAPFENAIIYDDGSVYFCCPSWLGVSAGSVSESPLEQVWNSAWAQSVRRSILDGTYSMCSALNCPHLQGAEGRIQRKEEVTSPYLRHIIDNDLTELPQGPKQVTVAYDPTCNLSCPSCRTESYKPTKDDATRIAAIHDNVMGAGLRDAYSITIAGNGDPFASKYYLNFLRNFDQSKYPDLKISFITNGLRLTPEMWDSIAPAHPAIRAIHCSVNGTSPESFRYNQRGGEIEKLVPNLRFMGQLRREGKFEQLSLGFYILANNFREMPSAVALAKEIGADSVYFGHILKAASHTEAEFRAIGVHLPDHPEHAEFLEVLKDPILLDPMVRLSNLTCFLPGNEHLKHLQDADLEGLVPLADLSWESFTARLLLSPEQATQVKRLIDAVKDSYVGILSERTASGASSPIEYLASLMRKSENDINDKLGEYNRHQKPAGRDATYEDVCFEAESVLRNEVLALLDAQQQNVFFRLRIESLSSVQTGHEPMLDKLQRLLARQENPGAMDLEQRVTARTWEECANYLKLDRDQARALRREIDALKDRFCVLYGRLTTDEGESPIQYLAGLLREKEPDATQRFFEYALRSREPQSGRAYAEVFSGEEMQCRARVLEMMTSEQQARWSALAITTLLDVPTGHEPFVERVNRELRQGGPGAEAAHPWSARYALAPQEARIAHRVVVALKKHYAELMLQPGADAAEAPLHLLARMLQGGHAHAQTHFIEFARTHQPEAKAKTYLVLLSEAEGSAWQRLERALTPDAVARLKAAAGDSLLALETTPDPFTLALQRLMTAARV